MISGRDVHVYTNILNELKGVFKVKNESLKIYFDKNKIIFIK